MKIMIAGLGLIGGSFAKAIKKYTKDTVVGYDMSEQVLQKAQDCGAIDERCGKIPIDADLILIALYPLAAVEFVRQHVDQIPAGCLIIDLCGVKQIVCAGIEALLENRDAVFIGGHPMAGKDFFGFDGADAELFQGASMILTPSKKTARNHLLLAELFFQRLGFGQITYTTPEEHDEMIALTSQLAHIVSSAYVQNPAADRHAGFSAGSFQDMTRVAKLNEEMWTELFLLNAGYLELQISQMVEKLMEFKQAIATGDHDHLCAILREGRLKKEALTSGGTNHKPECERTNINTKKA